MQRGFSDLSPIRLASIRDGTSHTLFLNEKATDGFRRLDEVEPDAFRRFGSYVIGELGDTLRTTFYPPDMPSKVGVVAGVAHIYAASSFHPAGINALMGDGSVHLITSTIDSWPFDPATGIPLGARRTPGGWWEELPPPGVWQALGTRAGSEIIPGSVLPR